MALSVGTRVGPYEILGPLGAGGMGEVYRASDTRLDPVVVPLFETRMSVLTTPSYTRNQYVVSGDGQRVLINQPPAGAPSSPITVVVNWPAMLKP